MFKPSPGAKAQKEAEKAERQAQMNAAREAKNAIKADANRN